MLGAMTVPPRNARTLLRTLGELAWGLALLTTFWALGAGIARLLPALPLTGSLWGLALLFLALRSGVIDEAWVARTSRHLIAALGLLFTPVGVGILAYERLVLDNAAAIAASLLIGSLATLLVAAAASRWARAR